MRNCPSCSNPIPADVGFCPSCGRDLTVSNAAPGPGPAPAQPVEAKTSGMAVASLIFSFFSLLLFPGILAIVFGHVSRRKIKRSAGKLKGKGVALAGLVLGYLQVLLIIAAIAIPNLIRSRIAAGQASAGGNLRTLNTAAITYASTYGRGFPSSPDTLRPQQPGKPEDAERANLIDEVLASGRKSGYVFTYKVLATDNKGLPSAYSINADPAEPGSTGQRYFFTDESGVIRSERDHPANKDSPPLTG